MKLIDFHSFGEAIIVGNSCI